MRCIRETHVLWAAAKNEWTAALREHVAMCSECAAAADVARSITRLAAIEPPYKDLPAPAVLWLKSRLLATPDVDLNVGRPVRIVQLAAYFAGAATWIVLLTRKWSALHAWISSFMAANIARTPEVASMPLFFLVLGVSSLAVTLVLHTILADEG